MEQGRDDTWLEGESAHDRKDSVRLQCALCVCERSTNAPCTSVSNSVKWAHDNPQLFRSL